MQNLIADKEHGDLQSRTVKELKGESLARVVEAYDELQEFKAHYKGITAAR